MTTMKRQGSTMNVPAARRRVYDDEPNCCEPKADARGVASAVSDLDTAASRVLDLAAKIQDMLGIGQPSGGDQVESSNLRDRIDAATGAVHQAANRLEQVLAFLAG